jgi:uncharacterized protein with PIN domain
VIVDASALLAVALNEPDGRRFAEAIAGAPRARMPAATWFEAALAVDTDDFGDCMVYGVAKAEREPLLSTIFCKPISSRR